jgi:hypothetical protein
VESPKNILETEKQTLKTLSSGQIYKKTKQKKMTQKNQKTHWAGFFFNPGFLPTLPDGPPW